MPSFQNISMPQNLLQHTQERGPYTESYYINNLKSMQNVSISAHTKKQFTTANHARQNPSPTALNCQRLLDVLRTDFNTLLGRRFTVVKWSLFSFFLARRTLRMNSRHKAVAPTNTICWLRKIFDSFLPFVILFTVLDWLSWRQLGFHFQMIDWNIIRCFWKFI